LGTVVVGLPHSFQGQMTLDQATAGSRRGPPPAMLVVAETAKKLHG
jgi:hypothetical protein